MILSLFACVADPPSNPCDAGSHLLLTTTDFEVGILASVDPTDGCVGDRLATTGPDAVVRTVEDRVLVMNRTGRDTVLAYTPGVYDRPVAEFVVEQAGNVHDVIRVGDEWWFTLYERAEIVRTDFDGVELGRIDLRDEADGDGIPEADRFVVTDAGIFLALQRLDRDSAWATNEGRIVRLDPEAKVVDGAWDVGPDPKLYADPSDPSAMIVLTGRFSEPDGALVRFDPDLGTVTPLVTEAALGRDLSGFAGIGGVGVLLGVDFRVDGPSTVDCVDLQTGGITPALSDSGWYVEAIAAEDRVYVAVRTGFAGSPAEGVLSIDPATCTVEPLADGFALDPYTIGWVP